MSREESGLRGAKARECYSHYYWQHNLNATCSKRQRSAVKKHMWVICFDVCLKIIFWVGSNIFGHQEKRKRKKRLRFLWFVLQGSCGRLEGVVYIQR